MHALARFEAVRRLLGHRIVIPLANLDTITRLPNGNALRLYAENLRAMQAASGKNAESNPHINGPQWPVIDQTNRRATFTTQTGNTIVVLEPDIGVLQLTYQRPNEPFDLTCGRDVALIWLSDDQSAVTKQSSAEVLAEAVARLAWIGLTDKEILDHGLRLFGKLTLREIWRFINYHRLVAAEAGEFLLHDAWQLRHPEHHLPPQLLLNRTHQPTPLIGGAKPHANQS